MNGGGAAVNGKAKAWLKSTPQQPLCLFIYRLVPSSLLIPRYYHLSSDGLD